MKMGFIPNGFDPSQLSPLNLAFVGDSVFDLFVRTELVMEANRPVKKLHSEAAGRVNAAVQARYAESLLPHLTEEEQAVFRRGKNADVHHFPKNMTREDYHLATALEAVFGFLYLRGNISRLEELADIIFGADKTI